MSWQTRTRIRRADIHQDGLTARSSASCSRDRPALADVRKLCDLDARARARSVTAGSSKPATRTHEKQGRGLVDVEPGT